MAAAITIQERATQIGSENVSDWVEVTQEMINKFADATGDHQFIHVNPEMAKMTPFGGTIVHGFFTLSMLAGLQPPGAIVLEGIKMGVNYGCDKVRFPSPVLVNSWIRGSGEVVAATAIGDKGAQVTIRITVQVKDQEKPGCVVETISRLFFQ